MYTSRPGFKRVQMLLSTWRHTASKYSPKQAATMIGSLLLQRTSRGSFVLHYFLPVPHLRVWIIATPVRPDTRLPAQVKHLQDETNSEGQQQLIWTNCALNHMDHDQSSRLCTLMLSIWLYVIGRHWQSASMMLHALIHRHKLTPGILYSYKWQSPHWTQLLVSLTRPRLFAICTVWWFSLHKNTYINSDVTFSD